MKTKNDPRDPSQMAWDQTDPTLSVPERSKAAMKLMEEHAKASRPVTNITLPGAPATETPQQQAATGDDYLGTLSPSLASQVKAISEGRASLPAASARSQAAVSLRNAVFHYDPQYSDQRAQIRKAFTSGPDGKNIGALNTGSVHLDQLADAAEAMHNGSFKPGNQLYNAVSSMFGGNAPSNFDGIKAAVAGEMASALKGSATDQEIHAIQATIDRSSSPEQLRGAVTTGLHTLGAKLNTYRERYVQQIPGDTVWSPVLPSAKAVFDKYGVNPTAAAGSGSGAGGTAYKFTAVGPNGHKIGSNGGPWVDIQTGKVVQ